MTHIRNQEKAVEVVEVDTFGVQRLQDFLVEVGAAARRDEAVRCSVILQDLATALHERRQIKVMR
ncbi:hypothetical protein RRF57_009312 [Xylaria bambusicola]|uniref:Uncharacterized protein n=1 Tax=Xylaria bambusicola TaxID=326684 RepID=A0AAN7UPN3_9PEZI